MNLKRSRRALLALGIGAALTAGLVPLVNAAQTPPQQLPANPRAERAPPPQERGERRDFDRRAERAGDRLERRLDFLHSELRITPAQEQAWTAFAEAVRREDQGDRDRRDQFRGGPDRRGERPGIVERLERRQQGLEEQRTYYDRLLSALRPLYASLDENQRRAADENLFSPGREDRGRRGGPRRYGMNRDFGRGFSRPFERPYGPFDPPYDSFDREYR